MDNKPKDKDTVKVGPATFTKPTLSVKKDK